MGTLLIFIAWVALSILLAQWGATKRVGFWPTLAIAILLSPVIGLVIVAISPDKDNAHPPQDTIQPTPNHDNTNSIKADKIMAQLKELQELKEKGTISELEYYDLKARIMQN